MQENTDITKKIMDRINSYPEGEIFYIQKFLDLGDYDSIKAILARLESSGLIRRMVRGVYEKPVYNSMLGELVEPNPQKVAKALAEKNGWMIAPSGETALNYLGISTQVPNTWEFISSGPSREYELKNAKLIFTHREDREFAALSPKTIMAVQALRAIGQERITEEMIANFAAHFDQAEREKMLAEGNNLPLWIYNCLKEIASVDAVNGSRDKNDA
ncbi:hypothetical protein IKF86_00650 [Candidatus Saccharibacteria bacterium]|nr:hypothetical protein [Candidatus Saccharibacteria bacterium]